MAFVTLGLIEMVHSFNIRSEESIFKCGLFKNKYLVLAFILGLVMQVRNCIYTKYKEYIQLDYAKQNAMAICAWNIGASNNYYGDAKEAKRDIVWKNCV